MTENAESSGTEAVSVALARMEGKIDTNFTAMRGDLQLQGLQLQGALSVGTDHETRIRTLEQNSPSPAEISELKKALADLRAWRGKLTGIIAATSACAALAASFIGSYLFK